MALKYLVTTRAIVEVYRHRVSLVPVRESVWTGWSADPTAATKCKGLLFGGGEETLQVQGPTWVLEEGTRRHEWNLNKFIQILPELQANQPQPYNPGLGLLWLRLPKS